MLKIFDKEKSWDIVIRWASTIILGVVAYLFWYVGFPFAMGYQEQFQMFLFDNAYFVERLVVPGGIATYIAEFLTQFYNSPVMGAAVIAMIYVWLQNMTWIFARRNLREGDNKWLAYILSFVPTFMLWYQMGDESTLLAYSVSLIITLAVMLMMPRGNRGQALYAAVCIPLTYWIVGPLALLFAVYSGIRMARNANTRLSAVAYIAVPVMYAVALILISALFVPYPLTRLFAGIYYYRLVEILSYMLIIIPLVILLLATVPLRLNIGKVKIVAPLVACAMAGIAAYVIPTGYDELKYDLVEYDWLVRQQRWNDIIAKSEQKQPSLPMSVCATNLALGMTGQLGDRCFDFFQNGGEGLMPPFERNFSTTLLNGEVCYLLGLVNTSQRYAFEAMEAIPNYNKSARAVKRLAETNLINGQYTVARKYLKMLQKTIFYKKWADRRMEMIDNPKLIDQHNVYGYLRKVRLADDFLFSDQEIDKICGQLVMRNKDNMMAMQYLLVYPLLDRDIPTFMDYYNYVQTLKKYSPRACVEAVALAYAMQRQLPQSEVERYKLTPTWRYLINKN